MNDDRDQQERATGEVFIEWYNRQHRTRFKLLTLVEGGSELVFRGGECELRPVITVAHLDAHDSCIGWTDGREMLVHPGASPAASFASALQRSINDEIEERCAREQDTSRVLILFVPPTVTTSVMLNEALEKVIVPKRNPFSGIYAVSQFVRLKRSRAWEEHVRQLG